MTLMSQIQTTSLYFKHQCYKNKAKRHKCHKDCFKLYKYLNIS